MEEYKYDSWSEDEVIDLTQEVPFVPEVPPQEVKAQGEPRRRGRGTAAIAMWFFTLNNPEHPVEGEILFAALKEVCTRFGFQYEEGEEGTPHYQGELWLKKRVRNLVPDVLDGFVGLRAYPTDKPYAAKNYCGKEEGRLDGPWTYDSEGAKPAKRNGFKEAMAAANRAAGMAIIREVHPRDYLLYGDRIESNLNRVFVEEEVKDFEPYDPGAFINVPQEIKDWVAENIKGPPKRRFKMLIIEGESMLGKSELVKSFGRHVYWTGCTNAKHLLRKDVDYLVIDDIEWETIVKLGFDKTVCLGKGRMTVTDRYLPKMDIVWNKPCIFVCNDQGALPWYTTPFWRANSVHVKLSDKLY